MSSALELRLEESASPTSAPAIVSARALLIRRKDRPTKYFSALPNAIQPYKDAFLYVNAPRRIKGPGDGLEPIPVLKLPIILHCASLANEFLILQRKTLQNGN